MKRAVCFMNKAATNFVSTWNTVNTSAGSSTSTQIKLPLVSTGTYNFVVNWGDGNSDTITAWNAAATTHTYASSGTYTVTIIGVAGVWQFNNSGDKLKILTIASWGKLKLGASAFHGCSNVTMSGITDVPDLSTVTGFQNTFAACTSITTIGRLNEWNVSSVTNMDNMFGGAIIFNQDLSTWNTGAVTTMLAMFNGATSFNNGLASGIDNQLPWNTSNVTNMASMFAYCPAFNSNLGTGTTPWDVSKVTTFSSMFQGATNFNNGNESTQSMINDWSINTVSSVIMFGMFNNTSVFNRNISAWNVTKVNTMEQMFAYASVFNQSLSNWERIGSTLVNVTNMTNMFLSCPSFNQSIGNWNVSSVTNFVNFMYNKTPATFSATNLDAIYNGWIVNGVQPNTSGTTNISFGTAKHTAAGTAGRLTLTSAPNNWIITDGGL